MIILTFFHANVLTSNQSSFQVINGLSLYVELYQFAFTLDLICSFIIDNLNKL